MITVDGAGFSHALPEHLDKLAARRGHTLIYPAGREPGEREKAAIKLVPEQAWEIAIDHRGEVRERRADGACSSIECGHRACWIEEAHVTRTLRYRVLHAAARLVRGGRRKRWKFAANWPWTAAITRAWQRICALPDTT